MFPGIHIPLGMIGGAPPYGGIDQIPTMTAATTSGVTMSASSEANTSFRAWMAGDNNYGSNDVGYSWCAAGTTNEWIKVDFGSARWIHRYSIRHYDKLGDANRCPRDWHFDGSNDNTSWTTLDTQSSQTSWTAAQRREFTLSSPANYRYYRIYITAYNGGSYLQIGEIELLA